MNKEQIQDFTLKISNANRTQLVVIIYEIALCYIEEGMEFLQKDEEQEFREKIRHVKKCLLELLETLDYEYSISYDLMKLYHYVSRELTRAGIQKDITALEHAKKTLKELHRSFLQLSEQDTSAPVMDNTQTIYAGLTYGKNNLNESLSDQGNSRGFRV